MQANVKYALKPEKNDIICNVKVYIYIYAIK